MHPPFNKELKNIADDMGISLYQRLSVNEASLFLRCNEQDVIELQQSGRLNFIQVTPKKIAFFGYQLLEHLLSNISSKTLTTTHTPDKIIRARYVQDLTGLSRTTLWRFEQRGEFPARVQLGAGSVGWRLGEVETWIKTR